MCVKQPIELIVSHLDRCKIIWEPIGRIVILYYLFGFCIKYFFNCLTFRILSFAQTNYGCLICHCNVNIMERQNSAIDAFRICTMSICLL